VPAVHLLLGDLEAATAVRAHAAPAVHVRGRVTTAVLDALLAAAAGHEHRASDHLENALACGCPKPRALSLTWCFTPESVTP
jgi:hypothetical protein